MLEEVAGSGFCDTGDVSNLRSDVCGCVWEVPRMGSTPGQKLRSLDREASESCTDAG